MTASTRASTTIFCRGRRARRRRRTGPRTWTGPAAATPPCGEQVERLVAAHFRAGELPRRPARRSSRATVDLRRPADGPGTVIGPYKLLEQIGEGGMGLVFVAEQTQPVRRQVALKVIKPGMDTRQVVARFEAERQALALMDHPNIAKVLDAGATDGGPAVLRHGAGPRRPDHRLLRPGPADRPRAARAVRAGLPGGPARPPEGGHPPRPQAVERPGRRCTTARRCRR